MSYDNGHSVPPTPGGYRTPGGYPAPPTPVAQQASYESHASYASSGAPESFYSVYSSSMPAKKKNTRASQACDQCRQLKAKCDETKPCKTCRDKGLECRYRDPVPKATDKAQADILDGIAALQASLSSISNNVERMEGRLGRIEDTFPPLVAKVFDREPKREHDHEHDHHGTVRDSVAESERIPTHITERIPVERIPQRAPEHAQERIPEHDIKLPPPPQSPYPTNGGGGGDPYYPHEHQQEMNMSNNEHHEHHMRMMADDEVDAEPGPPVPPGEPAIPINHTTLASLLLDWPAIRELTKHHVEREGIKYISEFPIRQEQNRGPLIVYGRGEDAIQARHVDHGTVDMMDEISEPSSPSPGADFGHLGGMSPPDNVEYKGGVLGFDGNPDFSEHKVWHYVESFKDNMLNMHPILPPRTLDAWVRQFLENLPTVPNKTQKTQTTKPAFAISTSTPSGMQNEVAGSKRKRSPGPEDTTSPSQTRDKEAKSGKPRRTLLNAVVLTVLAVGKVCLHRDSVPDVVHAALDHAYHGSPASRNGVPPSPNQASPPNMSGHPQSTQQSPLDYADRGGGTSSRRPSLHGANSVRSGFNLKKNYDVIPGLEYFAYASDILGNHMGSYNNIKNVYANLFAGLYLGQLARPLESFAYIHQASHKLQILLRPNMDRMRTFKNNRNFIQEHKYNQLALAFWTCLQLESDLIAELQLPPSDLLSYEEDMPPPNMMLVHGFSQAVLDSYPGQLYLRKHLNSIHRMFYAPDGPVAGGPEFRNVDLVADSVSGMHWVAPSFAFRENDPPAEDILAARLRAKYWGAQSITYRPFIRQILQFTHSLNHHPTSPNPPTGTEFRDGIIAPVIHPNTKSLGDIEPSVVELAKKGIKALVESTRPFHNLGDKRPIITNVFGTAHAQWGNLLVLSAAYRDPVLSKFIDEDLLKTLFHRTIAFLRQSSTATSSLRIDLGILEGLQRDLFYGPDPRTGSSFSSQPASAQTPTMPTSRPPMHMQRSMSDVNLAPPAGHHGGYSRGQ
jgi:hypothetical protein